MARNSLPFNCQELDKAIKQLKKDPKLKKLISQLPKPSCGGKKNPVDDFVVAIMNQMISRKAASTIEQRLRKLAGRPFDPNKIAKLPIEKIRSCGLSATKANCMKEFCKYVVKNKFSATSCKNLSNQQIIDILTSMRGAGPWTAHMVLIFGLGRMDVMPLDDGGIQRAAQLLYSLDNLQAIKAKLTQQAKKWSPYNSVAAWYLWRSLG